MSKKFLLCQLAHQSLLTLIDKITASYQYRPRVPTSEAIIENTLNSITMLTELQNSALRRGCVITMAATDNSTCMYTFILSCHGNARNANFTVSKGALIKCFQGNRHQCEYCTLTCSSEWLVWHIHTDVDTYHTNIRVHMHVHAHTHTNTYTHTYMHMHTHTHKHTNVHMYTRTYIHTRTQHALYSI